MLKDRQKFTSFHTNIPASDFGKVVVLYGGTSKEREISLISGKAVLAALQAAGIDAHGIDVDAKLISTLLAGQFNRAFIVLHGGDGEDGTIQGLLESINLPYTGSGVLGSAVTMDKIITKMVLQASNLPTPAYAMVEADKSWQQYAGHLRFPITVKPVHEGSSLGVTKVATAEALPQALSACQEYGAIMLEDWVEGDEFTVPILNNNALPVIKIKSDHGFYDYAAKYTAPDTHFYCPCGLATEQEQELQQLALAAFKATKCKGWGRVDIMQDNKGKFWVLEINTVPGMTPDHSLVPMAAKVAGLSFQELAVTILAETLTQDKGQC